MVARFMPLAARPARCLPTGTEPVNEILRTMSEPIRCSDTSAGTPNTRLQTPFGNPASTMQRTSSTQVPGVSSDALTMIEQPAASAAAILRAGVTRREIPRREGGGDADRLLDHELARVLDAARNDAAIGAAAFVGEPVENIRRGHHFHAGFGEDLALLHGHDGRDLLGALADQVGGLAHDLGAVIGRHGAPDGEALFGGGTARDRDRPWWHAADWRGLLPVAGLITSSVLRELPLSHSPSI